MSDSTSTTTETRNSDSSSGTGGRVRRDHPRYAWVALSNTSAGPLAAVLGFPGRTHASPSTRAVSTDEGAQR